jgi:hypothetical protein
MTVLGRAPVPVKESNVSKRYRMLLGTAVIVAIGAVGGIAAAEQGGNSAEHRQNPTTTSGPAADSTTTTTTLAHDAKPQGADDQSDAADQSNRTEALCWALQQGSERGQAMKAEHGRAFQGLECPTDVVAPSGDNESDDVADAGNQGDEGDQGQGGPPESPGQSGDHGGGSDNPNAQGHGKP